MDNLVGCQTTTNVDQKLVHLLHVLVYSPTRPDLTRPRPDQSEPTRVRIYDSWRRSRREPSPTPNSPRLKAPSRSQLWVRPGLSLTLQLVGVGRELRWSGQVGVGDGRVGSGCQVSNFWPRYWTSPNPSCLYCQHVHDDCILC